jgi:hypothetical protein
MQLRVHQRYIANGMGLKINDKKKMNFFISKEELSTVVTCIFGKNEFLALPIMDANSSLPIES